MEVIDAHSVEGQRRARIVEWMQKALAIVPRFDDPSHKVQTLIWLAYGFARQGHAELCAIAGGQALAIAQAGVESAFRANSLAEVALLYAQHLDRGKAKLILQESATAWEAISDVDKQTTAGWNVSRAAGKLGSYALAEKVMRAEMQAEEVRNSPLPKRGIMPLLASRCSWYIENGETALTEQAIQEFAHAVEARLPKSEMSIDRKRYLDRLVHVYLTANNLEAAAAAAVRIEGVSLEVRHVAERLWKLRRKEEYQTLVTRQRRFAVHPEFGRAIEINSLQALEEMQRALGDLPGYAVTLEAAERWLAANDGGRPWERCAAYAALAVMQHFGGDADAADGSLAIARSAAEEQTRLASSSLVNTVWLSVSKAELRMGRFDESLASAEKIPKFDSRVAQVVKALAGAGRDFEALEIIRNVESPQDAARYCWWIAGFLEHTFPD